MTREARSPSEIESSRSESRHKESTSELDAKVLELLKQNIPAIRIAEILERQKSTIYRVQDRLLNTGQIKLAEIPDNGKRKATDSALELKARVKELSLVGNSPIQISKSTKKSKQAIYLIIKGMISTGELKPEETTYTKAGPEEERHRYKIIETVARELSFYEKQELVPTGRKMGYRLIELAIAARQNGADLNKLIELGLPILPDINAENYSKEKHLFFGRFYGDTAEARRGVDYTYTKKTYLPKLPLECFRDDLRETIGNTDMDYRGSEPTPATPAPDPEDWIDGQIDWPAKDEVEALKDAPDNYNGECESGYLGRNAGYWYLQPIYAEIFCESETIQPDLIKNQGDRKVRVSAMRGQFSTPFIVKCANRLKEIAESYSHIKKIIILYFGDSDKAGNDIRKKVEVALKFYSGGGSMINLKGEKIEILASPDITIPVEIELRHVMITPAQVKKYKLTGYQLEAFMTTEKRLEQFKEIVQKSIDGCWSEDIWKKNCPPKEYDYKAHNEEEPEDIDADEEGYEGSEETFREFMQHRVNEALETIWDD